MRITSLNFKASENISNFLFVTCEANIFLIKETFQEALYGSEAVISYSDKNGNIQWKEILEDNGIWSKEIYSNVDIVFFIKSETNLLEDAFHPYIFPNPNKFEKLRRLYKPFSTMRVHLPPTMLGKTFTIIKERNMQRSRQSTI